MKLSISNIAWAADDDQHMYEFLRSNEFSGIEIAPTRIIPTAPYDHLQQALAFKAQMDSFNLKISSMQSIWYGRTENIFNSAQERQALIAYTHKAIDFAQSIDCNNLVFGSPKNRTYQSSTQISESIPFFKTIADYAHQHHTCIALEANPPIYNTNFINTTTQAITFVQTIAHPALKTNLDFGTIIQNEESLSQIEENISLINHIHISEPFLAVPQKRFQHRELAQILIKKEYKNFISIEMKNPGNLDQVKQTIAYVKEVFD
jgi:sugar phosphate isomerase/epimerase